MVNQSIAILTYHSISDAAGPTSIPPAVFSGQMEAIADLGISVVGLGFVRRWLEGEERLSGRTVAITFDDAFEDFAEAAHPALASRKFVATVFVPTAIVGQAENWKGANTPARSLMDWKAIAALAAEGVEFGSHTRTHADLTTLGAGALRAELGGSRKELEDRLGRAAPHFAPPYGRSNAEVRRAIAETYDLSVGVDLGEATRASVQFDLPRIEMHYYRDLKRWRAFLAGGGQLYLQSRRLARNARQSIFGRSRRSSQ